MIIKPQRAVDDTSSRFWFIAVRLVGYYQITRVTISYDNIALKFELLSSVTEVGLEFAYFWQLQLILHAVFEENIHFCGRKSNSVLYSFFDQISGKTKGHF